MFVVIELILNEGLSTIMLDWNGRELEHPNYIKEHNLTGQSSFYSWLKNEVYESAITIFNPWDKKLIGGGLTNN